MGSVRLHLMGALIVLSAGCDEGPAVHANAQTIAFSTAPITGVDQTTVVVSATASSGLPVRHTSLTRTVCSVDGNTGLQMGLTSGTCTIASLEGSLPSQAAKNLHVGRLVQPDAHRIQRNHHLGIG